MKTDDLIAFLSDDLAPARRGIVLRWLMLGFGGGAVLSALAMWMVLGPRPDLHAAMLLTAFWVKIAYTAALALLGLVIVQHQARAGAEARRAVIALGVPVVAMILLAAWQLSAPYEDSARLVMGQTWMVCPWRILALSLPISAGLMLALRQLAPTRLGMAGASAGLVAGAAAAVIYCFHCQEMAAPFVLIWYTFGIALSTALGALAGRWLLRW